LLLYSSPYSWGFPTGRLFTSSITSFITAPSIAITVQQACLYMHAPWEPHLNLVKRILRYIKGTLDFGMRLSCSAMTSLTTYSDADWAGCPDTQRWLLYLPRRQSCLLVLQAANYGFPLQCGGRIPGGCTCRCRVLLDLSAS
jgi:hypothetical protein